LTEYRSENIEIKCAIHCGLKSREYSCAPSIKEGEKLRKNLGIC
jgi:hypothetical protein